MDDRVELVGRAGPEVVAVALGFRPVNHTDCPLKARGAQGIGRPRCCVEAEHELFLSHVVHELLDAVWERRPHPLSLGRPFPAVGRRDRPGIGGEPHDATVAGMTLADQLADIQLAASRVLGGPDVAEVRIVRPHDDLGGRAQLLGEVTDERFKGCGHVTIAQVPRRDPPAEHRPVVLLGRLHRAGILFCVEQFVLRDQAVPPGILRGMPLQVDELLDHRTLALLARTVGGSEPVNLGVVANEMVEARVALTRPGRRLGIHPIEVADDFVDGSVQAVQIQAVETGPGHLAAAQPIVVLTLPGHEIQHVGVPPHPGREALESAQRLVGGRVGIVAPDIPVYAVRIGPVRFRRYSAESTLLDQPAGHMRPCCVELAGAVRGPADQHQVGVADEIEQNMVGRCALFDRQRVGADDGGVGRWRGCCSGVPRPPSGTQQIPYLLIGRLGEIPVGVADSEERGWRGRADHLVSQGSQFATRRFRRGRCRNYNLARLQRAKRLNRGAHARPGSQAVVDQDHYFPGQLWQGSVLPAGLFAAEQLAALLFRDLLDDIRRYTEAADHVIVDHDHAAAGDGAHSQFLPAGHAELADEEDVKRGQQSGCHLIRHGHPATGKAEHDDIGTIPEVLEEAGQVSASIPPVAEETVWHGLRPVLDALV
jgi:hypothetical protein